MGIEPTESSNTATNPSTPDLAQVDDASRPSEHPFRNLVEKSIQGILVHQEHRPVFVNESWAALHGYEISDVMRMESVLSLIAAHDCDRVVELVEACIQGEPAATRFEYEGIHRNGSQLWLESNIGRVIWDGCPAIQCTTIDISDRKQVEEALRESESRLRQIIDLVPHMIFAKDEQGRFVLVNRAVAEAYGMTVEELLGRAEPELHVSAEEMERFLANDREVIRSGRSKFIPEEEWTGADGQIRFLQTTKIPAKLPGSPNPVVLGVAVDISERKWAESELKALNESLSERVVQRTRTLQAMAEELHENVKNTRLIIDTANEAFVSMGADGVIYDWNPQAESTFGWTRTEVFGRKVVDTIIPPRYREAHNQGLKRFLATRQGRVLNDRLEITALHRDGHEFPIELTIAPTPHGDSYVFHAFMHDITQRKRNEQQLHLQSSALQAAANTITITDREGIITWVNSAFTELTGYSADEAIGKTHAMLKSGKHDQAFYKRIWITISSGRVWQGEIINKRKDGSLYTEEMTITPVRDEDHQIAHYVAIKQDISARKKAEEDLAEIAAGLALRRRGLDVKGVIHLNDFTLTDLNHCGAEIRGMGAVSQTQAEFAERLVSYLHGRFVDQHGQSALALVRCFETCPFASLDEELKEIALATLAQPAEDTNCMKLVATAGDQASWNEVHKSNSHRVIPLPSAEAIERLPMISQLLRQLGLEVGGVLQRSSKILVDTALGNVFHIPDAQGSPYIPDQEGFVVPFGIRSVVGFGDVLPNGNLIVVILFSKIPISRECALLFSHLSLSMRLGLLPFLETENRIEEQLLAIDQLLKNHEEIVSRQESQLLATLGDLNNSNAALERSNLDLQQFAYSASHDLQEPLRSVAGFCQLLQRRYGGQLDREAEEWIEFVVEGARRMRALIEDLLVFSRVDSQALPFTATDCEGVFDEAISILHSSIKESDAVITKGPLPMVMCDRSQLVHVLQNLIGNGIKFHGDEPPRVHVSARQLEDQIELSVKDNGIGIPADKLEFVFEIFRRLHSQQDYPGTGIGLAICRRVIQRHGGRVWVESELGRGSSFYFTLKAATADEDARS